LGIIKKFKQSKMKKLLLISILTFASAFYSFAQNYSICYDLNCIYVWPPPPPGYPYAPSPCFSPSPSQVPLNVPYNCPIECQSFTIVNYTACELDFWWDYNLSPPCTGIVPAYYYEPWIGYLECPPWNWPQWPPAAKYFNHTVAPNGNNLVIRSYEMQWDCGEGLGPCVCPNELKWRVGNPTLALLAPFAPDALGLINGTYTLTATCSGVPITLVVSGSNNIYTFY
jgi:hypothetical protein